MYSDNQTFLRDVLGYCRLAVSRYHQARTVRNPGGSYAFRDAVLRPEDIVTLLTPWEDDQTWCGELAARREAIRQAAFRALREGTFLPLAYLCQVFDCDDFAFHCLCMSLAVELDRRFERVFGFLLDDLSCRRPNAELLIRTYAGFSGELTEGLARFAAPEPLTGLLYAPYDGPLSVLSRPVRLEESICAFVLGGRFALPARCKTELGLWYESAPEAQKTLLSGLKADQTLAELHKEIFPALPRVCALVQLFGAEGAGKRTLTLRYAARGGQGVLLVDLRVFMAQDDREKALRTLLREAFIRQSVVCLRHVDPWLEAEQLARRETGIVRDPWEALAALIREIMPYTTALFVHTRREYKLSGLMPGMHFCHVGVETPDSRTRLALWKAMTGEGMDEAMLEALAGKYALTPGQMKSALADVRHGEGRAAADLSALDAACQRQLVHSLEKHARRIPAIFDWEDLILPAEPVMLLRRAAEQARHRRIVLEQWDFQAKLPYGRGLSLLFSGASGTGKTMAAQVLARELGLELYKVDLSCVVSKYIGETEQNLRVVFDEAQKSQAILFFDEADALFGKRTEVKDSHDKNANMEVSFLLQKLEEHDGIVVLSTNLLQNIDAAFKRRIHYIVEFAMPDAALRLRLWHSVFPPQAPRGAIDYDFLAERFAVSGSHIKNVALSAAYEAAAKGEVIGMAHIVNAMRIESKKLGKLLSAVDFAEYGHFCVSWQ